MATNIDAFLAANGLPSSYGTTPYGGAYSASLAPIQTVDPSQVQPTSAAYDPGTQAPPGNALASNDTQPAQPSYAPTGNDGGPSQAMVDAAITASKHRSLRDIIGGVGDALAAFGGKDPTYAPYRQQQQLRQAFADWQANPNSPQAQANFLAVSPQDAFVTMQQRRANQFAALKSTLDIQKQQRDNALSALGTVNGVLKRARDSGQDVGQAYDQLHAAGYLDALGMHPAEVAAYRGAIVNNPSLIDSLAPPPESVILPGGEGAPSTLVNKATGKPIAVGAAGSVKLGPGEGLFPTGGGQPANNDPTAQPATGNPAAASSAPSIVSGNNHGAIRDGAWAQAQPGYTGKDANGFATFTTPGAGITAQEKLLRTNYLGKGINTVNDIVDKYAPAKENSPESQAAYKKYVASQLGVAPDQPISGQQLRPLAAAMRNFETGQTGGAPITAPRSIAGGASAPPGAIAFNGNGELTPQAQQQAAEQYILTGQIPAGLGRNGMSQKQIIDAAAGLGYTPGQISAIRARNAADTTSLSTLESNATTVRSAEGAAEKNAGLVLSLGSKVANGNVPIFNAWRNTAAEHRGQGPIAAFNTAIGTFVNQYATVMGKGTPTEGLRHEGQEMINSAQSPAQLKSTVATMQADMANMKQSYEDERASTSARLAGGLPKPVKTPQEAAALAKGERFITPDGRFGTR